MAVPRKTDDLTEPSPPELRALEEGRADFAAGRYVDHEAMAKWLGSWAGAPKAPAPSDKA